MKDKETNSKKANDHKDQSEIPDRRPKHIQEHMKELEKLGFVDRTRERLGQTSVYFIPRRKS